MTVEIVQEAGDWPALSDEWAKRAETAVFAHFGFDLSAYESTVLFTDDAHIRTLNQAFRDKDKATDVLSWPSVEIAIDEDAMPILPPKASTPFAPSLGDIALGYETCKRDAKGRDFEAHILHLIIHGYLHLFGFDHIDDDDAEIMQAHEIEILRKMHIDNPYEF